MNNFHSFILAFAAGLLAFASHASTTTHTFNIDNPDNVTIIQIIGTTYNQLSLVAGENKIEIEWDSISSVYASYYIASSDDSFLYDVSYTYNSSTVSAFISNKAYSYVYFYQLYGDVTTTVTTYKKTELQTNKLVVNVDDPDAVKLVLYSTYSIVDLEAGQNTVYFADFQNQLQISHTTYGSYLYRVALNGTKQTISGNYYYIYVSDGDTLDITANYPDIDLKFKISVPDGCQTFITSVTADGTAVPASDYYGDDFTVKAGTYMYVAGNTTDYTVNSMTVNGVIYSFSTYYAEILTEDTEVVFDLTKAACDTVTVTIDNPEAITLKIGTSTTVELEAGQNTIEVPQTTGYLIYTLSSDYNLDSLIVDGEPYTSSIIYTANGMTIDFNTSIIVRDNTIAIYGDDLSIPTYYYWNAGGRLIYPDTAYVVLSFDDDELPLRSYCGANPYVYLNGSLLEPTYSGTTTYIYASYFYYDLTDGDIVKFFFTGEPSYYTASFTIDGDTTGISVTKDVITAVTDWQSGITDFQGTRIDIAGSEIVAVTVDGTALTPASGIYSFSLEGNSAVSITTTEAGVVSPTLSTSPERADSNVYNAAGILLIGNATDEQISNLPHGFYIIKGQKVIK